MDMAEVLSSRNPVFRVAKFDKRDQHVFEVE